jgi:hypothetical protein
MSDLSARCQCGALSLRLGGEPLRVFLCCCTECQGQTGSAYGVGAVFSANQVRDIQGPEKTYTRSSDAGRWVRQHFCTECGTTVYWEAEFRPGALIVAYGAIESKESLSPMVAAWTEHKAPWVELPRDIAKLGRQS